MILIEFDENEQIDWRVWLLMVKHAAGWKCARCDSSTKLEAHHIDRDRTNNSLANGECICFECHLEEHEHDRHAPRPWSDTTRERFLAAIADRPPSHYEAFIAAGNAARKRNQAERAEQRARDEAERKAGEHQRRADGARRAWATKRARGLDPADHRRYAVGG